jgi:hypothetical protein
MGQEPAMEMRDRQWHDASAGMADDVLDPPGPAVGGYPLDDDAVASVIGYASRLIAGSLAPIGRGLLGGGDGTGPDSGDLLRAAIQIEAVTALYRRLARPRPIGVSIEGHCRALSCDLVLALGRVDITPRVAMCDASLSAERDFRLAILVVELIAGVLNRDTPPREGGVVWVTLTPVANRRLELSVSDNFGPVLGRPCSHPPRMAALVKALSGDLIPAAGPAGAVRVRFPLG